MLYLKKKKENLRSAAYSHLWLIILGQATCQILQSEEYYPSYILSENRLQHNRTPS